MSQDEQLIGELSPEAQAVNAKHLGWGEGPLAPVRDSGDPTAEPQPLGQMITSREESLWNRRANMQLMYREINNLAGCAEEPMAGVEVIGFDPYAGDGGVSQ